MLRLERVPSRNEPYAKAALLLLMIALMLFAWTVPARAQQGNNDGQRTIVYGAGSAGV